MKDIAPGPNHSRSSMRIAQYVTPSYPGRTISWYVTQLRAFGSQIPDGNTFLDCNAGVAVFHRPLPSVGRRAIQKQR